ncbi:MAG: hypothetical protein Fur0039_01150 [Rhodocyclaceae bacterium]
MRHQWHADARDLIEWGALIHLAEEQGIERIIQVAYLRPDRVRPIPEYGNNSIEMPVVVWSHFRDLNDIKRLAKKNRDKNRSDLRSIQRKRPIGLLQSSREALPCNKGRSGYRCLGPRTGIAEDNAKPGMALS